MGTTTISVEESTLERFKRLKSELDDQQTAPDHTADSFLSALLDTWERDQPNTPPLSDGASMDTDALRDELRKELSAEDMRAQLETDAPTYDDIVQASRKAIREEFPDEVLRG